MKINEQKLKDVVVNYHGWLLRDHGGHTWISNGTTAEINVNNDGAGFYTKASGPLWLVVLMLGAVESCIEEG